MRPRLWVTAALAAVLCVFGRVVAAQAAADSITIGSREIPVGQEVRGPVVVAGGNLVVRGTITGSAIAIAGDVVVDSTGRVTGDAIAAFGDVRNAGQVGGVVRPLTGTFGASVRSLLRVGEAKPVAPRSPMSLALGWLTVIMVVGLGVLVFASPYLEGVVDVLEQSFWRSFSVGLLGEIGVLPAIVLLVIALAVTVIGVLLIPFAVVAAVLAVAGLATLGFVAVARLTGGGIGRAGSAGLSARGSSLRGVIVGLGIYMGLWILAAALHEVPVAGTGLRLLALAATFIAATAGFGAAILSRGGTRRDAAVIVPAPASAGWQTPTPVSGVVAARRPTRPTADVSTGR